MTEQKTGAVYLVTSPYKEDVDLKEIEYTLSGVNAGEEAGRNLASNCDINGDGENDLLISAITGSGGGGIGSGVIYLLYGPFNGVGDQKIAERADASFVGSGAGASAGQALACADMNIDGYDDMITSSPSLGAKRGGVFMQMGNKPYGLGQSLYNADWILVGTADGQRVGQTLVAGMNVNGDKTGDDSPIPDLLVSSLGSSTLAEALLFHGPFTDIGSTYDWYEATAVFYEQTNGEGLVLGSAGDINADGLDDLLFGSPGHQPAGTSNKTGAVFLQLGEGI